MNGRFNCDMGVGCDEVGKCYAATQGQPERCSLAPENLMDANAKVVTYRFRVVTDNGNTGPWVAGNGRNKFGDAVVGSLEYQNLIPLTDHEAALAEAEETLSRFISGTIEDTLTIDQLTAKHEQLLTGLEALAGEWFERSSQHRIRTGNDSSAQLFANELRDRIRAQSPAAANPESEE